MPRTGEIHELERLRRRAGYGVMAFARKVGFSHTYVSLVEAGKLRPSARFRRRAAQALHVPEAMLFGWTRP
jgi:transcriptional regulator with XRE-family HTH domain